MLAKYLVHHHKAGRPHFDLRLIQGNLVRSWSMRREPPLQQGVHRLAIEMEALSEEDIGRKTIEEESFGTGRAFLWDTGEVEISAVTPDHLVLCFAGRRLAGEYELRRMRWYPGNRWLLKLQTGN